jgi:hypothetical protein
MAYLQRITQSVQKDVSMDQIIRPGTKGDAAAMKTAILYARTSDERGAIDRSHLAAQLASLRERALQRGLNVIEESVGENADADETEKEQG